MRSLAAMRIGFGCILLWDLLWRARFLTQFYTDAGATPTFLFADPSQRWRSVYFLVGSRAGVAALFAVHAVFAALLALGLFTRLANFACVVFTWSLVNRNVHVMHGGDELLIWMLIWLLFLPTDAVLSIDRLRRRRKGQQTYTSPSICTPATAGLLLQVILIYWGAVAGRASYPEWWSNFSAVHYFLGSYNGTPLGQRLADAATFTRISTAGTMLWESLAPPIALICYRAPRLRTVIVAMFIVFHFALGRLMYLGIFESVCMVAWLAFVPGMTWDALRWKLSPAADERASARLSMRWPESKLAAAIASAILLFVLTINFVNDIPHRMAMRLGPIGRLPKLKQWWAMMANPAHANAHLVTEAVLVDGTMVRLDAPGTPQGYWPLLFPPGDVRVGRYRQAVLEAPKDQRDKLLECYCQWYWRNWIATHGQDERVRQIRVSMEVVQLPAFDADEILAGFPMQATQRRFELINWSPPQSASQ